MIRKILKKIFFKIVSPSDISIAIESHYIKRLAENITLGYESRLYKESKIFNFRKNKVAIEIGSRSHMRGELLTFPYGGMIKIGDNCYVGEGTRIWSGENVIIGNNVLIAHNCNIIDTNSHELDHEKRAESFKRLITQGHAKVKGDVVTKQITIGDYAWISYQVSILKGVTIGKGAIVAAGSVVTKDVADFTMVAGNPAIFLKRLK